MQKIPLFKDNKEFFAVGVVFIVIFLVRLFFYFQDYQELKSKDFYYTIAKVERVYKKDNKKFLVRLNSIDNLRFFLVTSKDIKPNSLVRAKLKLKKSTSFLEYLRGFFAYGDIVEVLDSSFEPKRYFKDKIIKEHKSVELASFYNAIYLAEPLEKDIRDRITALGISHLVALSGFHLGIIWLILFGIFGYIYKFFQKRYFPYRNIYLDLGFFTIAVIFIYVLFVGSPPSLIRSFIMLFIGWILLIFGLELISFKLLFFTTFLVIAIFPKLLFSYSFLLSVAGVYYIFLILKWQKESFNLLKTIFIIPIGVFILMFPISHYIFPNSSIWQLASPILSVLFIIFYPLSLILHLLGYGDLFDNILSSLLILPRESVNIIMPIGLFTIYLILSIFAIFSKKAYIATFILALLITIWYMLLL